MPTPYLGVGHREHRRPGVELAHQAGLGYAQRLLLHGLKSARSETTKTTTQAERMNILANSNTYTPHQRFTGRGNLHTYIA